jgi:hypothetical protein
MQQLLKDYTENFTPGARSRATLAGSTPALKGKEKMSNTKKEVAQRKENMPSNFLSGYQGPIGTEQIDAEDVTIPRLKIGQAISDEVKSGAVKEGAIYINVSGETVWNPGDPPLPILIVAQSKEYILWRPRKDGGGILARAKPIKTVSGGKRYAWDKPAEEFHVKIDGKTPATWRTQRYVDEDGLAEWGSEIPGNPDSGPAASSTHNYLVQLPTHDNAVCAISLSRSGVKIAKNLNATLKMGPPKIPVPLRKFTLSTFDDVGAGEQKFKNWAFKADGNMIDSLGNLLREEDRDIASAAMQNFQTYSETGFVVDQSDNVATDEGTATAKPKVDDEIPY